jgi:hypothetical protein
MGYFGEEIPVRLCCMKRHWGVECPDGTFMCCLCFVKVSAADAFKDKEGTKWDMCQECGKEEERHKGLITTIQRGIDSRPPGDSQLATAILRELVKDKWV